MLQLLTEPEKSDSVYSIDSIHAVQWRGSLYRGRIVEKRQSSSGIQQYYMHYLTFDRRLDEWVDAYLVEPDDLAIDILDAHSHPKLKAIDVSLLEHEALNDLEKERQEITKIVFFIDDSELLNIFN